MHYNSILLFSIWKRKRRDVRKRLPIEHFHYSSYASAKCLSMPGPFLVFLFLFYMIVSFNSLLYRNSHSFRHSAIVFTTSSTTIGFDKCPFIPASKAIFLSSSKASEYPSVSDHMLRVRSPILFSLPARHFPQYPYGIHTLREFPARFHHFFPACGAVYNL